MKAKLFKEWMINWMNDKGSNEFLCGKVIVLTKEEAFDLMLGDWDEDKLEDVFA